MESYEEVAQSAYELMGSAEESEKRFDPLPARDFGYCPFKEKAW